MARRPKLLRAIGVLASCLCTIAAPVAGSTLPPGASIEANYKILAEALIAKNAANLSLLLTGTFYQRLMNGSVETRKAFISDETGPDSGTTLTALTYHLAALTVSGDRAIARVSYSYTGTLNVDGVAKTLNGLVHLTDTWTRDANGRWKLTLSTMHDAVAYVDGKLVEDQQEQLPPTKAAVAALKARAVLIPTLALNADPDALAGVGAAVGESRIVAMGEGSHGSSEFFAFKNRLFKYLVENKGFTVFALEAYWGAGLYVDRFIKTGKGTAQQAVASLAFWTWDTPEMVDLVQWMRDYNLRRGSRPALSFVGIDMQDPMGAIGYLATYLHRNDPAEAAAARAALECAAESASRRRAIPAPGCREQVVAVGERLQTLQNAAGDAIAEHSVATILQYLDSKNRSEEARSAARDRDMADNVEWIAAAYPTEKIALWAHNFHVGTRPLFNGSTDLNDRPMGEYLRSAFGRNYYAIGQTFGSGTVRAIVSGHGLEAVTVPPDANDTIASLFNSLGAAAVFVDLRGLRSGTPLWSFFSTQRPVEEIGATMDPAHPAYAVSMVVPKSFDGLVYAAKSTASTERSQYSQMKREVRSDDGSLWLVSGLGFDDVTVTASADGAALNNDDGLNASPNTLLRRFDAAPYAGLTVRITGELRSADLLGFVYPFGEATASAGSIVGSAQADPFVASSLARWTPFQMSFKVPRSAQFIDAGFWAEGVGSVETRNIKVLPMEASHRDATSP